MPVTDGNKDFDRHYVIAPTTFNAMLAVAQPNVEGGVVGRVADHLLVHLLHLPLMLDNVLLLTRRLSPRMKI